MDCWRNQESTTQAGIAEKNPMQRREFFRLGISVAGGVGTRVAFRSIAAAAQRSEQTSGPLDAPGEVKKIAFDRVGTGENVLPISGFLQTRRSWNWLISFLSPQFQLIPADLPGFGDSGILSAPFRMTPIFETAAPQYDWINRIIAVGAGHHLPDGPLYSLFEVL